MSIFRNKEWERTYKERLGKDVFDFINKDPMLLKYLTDYTLISEKIKPNSIQPHLDDYSMFVLHLCKFFEGVLLLIAKDSGWYEESSWSNSIAIRRFFLNHREDIEKDIKERCPNESQRIIDKLFSTVEDFTERHKAVHHGSLIKAGEIDNYDAILTKVRDIVRILIENKILV